MDTVDNRSMADRRCMDDFDLECTEGGKNMEMYTGYDIPEVCKDSRIPSDSSYYCRHSL